MAARFLFSLITLLSLTSCAEMQLGRSYISAMEQDDSSFFNPEKDFPVVAGDSGKSWMTEEERRQRTPASKDELMNDRSGRALRSELRNLESAESEETASLYAEYKDKMRSISERIYFLKLPPHERKEYLTTRGFVKEPEKLLFAPHERVFAIRKNDILMGMTKTDVMESLGKPLRVEVAGNPRNENERWLYRLQGNQKYIYFESGKVGGWE